MLFRCLIGAGCFFRVLDGCWMGAGCLFRVLDAYSGCWMLFLGAGWVLDGYWLFLIVLSSTFMFYPALLVLDGCWMDYFRNKGTIKTGEVLDAKCWRKHNDPFVALLRPSEAQRAPRPSEAI